MLVLLSRCEPTSTPTVHRPPALTKQTRNKQEEDRVGIVNGIRVPVLGAVNAAVVVILATILVKARKQNTFDKPTCSIMCARVSADVQTINAKNIPTHSHTHDPDSFAFQAASTHSTNNTTELCKKMSKHCFPQEL